MNKPLENDLIDAGQIVCDYIAKLEKDVADLNDRLSERQKTFMAKFVEQENEIRRLKLLVKQLIPTGQA